MITRNKRVTSTDRQAPKEQVAPRILSASRQDRVNLPRCGIFLPREAKRTSIAWQNRQNDSYEDSRGILERIQFNCFLCGAQLTVEGGTESSATDEDVFPKWVQAYFDLRDRHFYLHDGSERKYNETLIPCCAKCNNEYMSRFEARIARALKGGFDQISQLRKADVFLWCAKIYYGLLHHEAKPRDWRTNQSFEPTISPRLLDDLGLLLLLLQGFRKRLMVFGPDHLPFSILRLPLHATGEPAAGFRTGYLMHVPAIALQLGRVGIICVLDDFGATEDGYRELVGSALSGKLLHPEQFWELAGRLFYLSYRHPLGTRMMMVDGPHDMMLDLDPYPLGDVKYDPADEADLLATMTQLPRETFFDTDGRIKSILLRSDRSFNEQPFSKYPCHD